MVILGAASLVMGLDYEDLQKAISQIFKRKGQEVIDINLKALQKGYEFAKKANQK